MNNTFIKMWRSMREWEWYKDSNTKCLFLHILLSANHAENKWMGITVLPGQWITSSLSLADATGLSRQNIRTSLDKLKSTNEITIKSTNRYILITVTNWLSYQSDGKEPTNRSTSKSTINQPSTNQQLTTNKNDKKGRMKRIDTISTDDKTPYGKYNNVLLTQSEYDSLVDDYGKGTADIYVDKVSGWYSEYPVRGNSSKNHYEAVTKFMGKDSVQKQKPQEPIQELASPEKQMELREMLYGTEGILNPENIGRGK